MNWKKSEWRPVVGYEGLYEVSDKGEVRALEKSYTDSIGRKTTKKAHILNGRVSKYGYVRITLEKNGQTKTYNVHRLVAEAFIANPSKLPYVNHIDEDKTNNSADNLEWCTAKYNCNYGTRNQRMRDTLRRVVVGKSIIATTKDGLKERYKSVREAARKLDYPHTGISNALNGRAHTACGRVWEYAEA